MVPIYLFPQNYGRNLLVFGNRETNFFQTHLQLAPFLFYPSHSSTKKEQVNIPPCGEILHKTMQMWRNTLQPCAKKAVPLQFFAFHLSFFHISPALACSFFLPKTYKANKKRSKHITNEKS